MFFFFIIFAGSNEYTQSMFKSNKKRYTLETQIYEWDVNGSTIHGQVIMMGRMLEAWSSDNEYEKVIF